MFGSLRSLRLPCLLPVLLLSGKMIIGEQEWERAEDCWRKQKGRPRKERSLFRMYTTFKYYVRSSGFMHGMHFGGRSFFVFVWLQTFYSQAVPPHLFHELAGSSQSRLL